ncbi:AMP-binding protein [Belnapia sp. T18]|uniref:AMP-binding protein n=1 Tax=Belnapia arida TaxID=2804533 RepID=A0ABS1U3Q2_9PROT|nr:AMP-binding protein [Belnapia arida]MBL6078579.1 AMP-binding protein [Belnapia arida]
MMTPQQHLDLSESAVLRVLRSLLAAELTAAGRRIRAEEAALWPADLTLDESGLGLDSLERLTCAAAVNAFFHLHETGIEDYLLARHTLSGWAEVVRAALAEGVSGLTVTTSGSTGERRPCTHSAARLLAEGAHWAGRFTDRRRILTLVPAHHIYGFLFTALLPDLLGLPVQDARALAPGRLLREVAPGDLLVGFPTGFSGLLRSIGPASLPADVEAVSSTAPLPAGIHQALRCVGFGRVTEVYGSSETGGIATRIAPEESFRLLPWWRPGEAGSIVDAETGRPVPLPDNAVFDKQGGAPPAWPQGPRRAGRRGECIPGPNRRPPARASAGRRLRGAARFMPGRTEVESLRHPRPRGGAAAPCRRAGGLVPQRLPRPRAAGTHRLRPRLARIRAW